MTIAVFSDVEGTLVDANIPQLWLDHGLKLGMYAPPKVALILAAGALGRVLPGSLRRALLLGVLLRTSAGQTEAEVARLIDAVLPTVMAQIKQPILQRLREHQAAGADLVLISAGMHQFTSRLAQELGGRGEGTHIHLENGRYTARVDGGICQSTGKADRAKAVMAERGYDASASYAYGDTANDLPFLKLFGHPHVVDPDPKLQAEATSSGWEIVYGR